MKNVSIKKFSLLLFLSVFTAGLFAMPVGEGHSEASKTETTKTTKKQDRKSAKKAIKNFVAKAKKFTKKNRKKYSDLFTTATSDTNIYKGKLLVLGIILLLVGFIIGLLLPGTLGTIAYAVSTIGSIILIVWLVLWLVNEVGL